MPVVGFLNFTWPDGFVHLAQISMGLAHSLAGRIENVTLACHLWIGPQMGRYAQIRKMTFRQGVSENPGGNGHRTRHLLKQEFMQALLLHFRKDGKKVIEKVARNQPAAYIKIWALLIPKEMKIEHFSTVKDLTDEELQSGSRCHT